MPQSIVITRPFYDNTTAYLHRWNKLVVEEIKRRSSSFADLEYQRVNKKEFESVVKKIKPNVILLNGHGGPDEILGDNHSTLIKVGVNDYILKNSVVYALSCSSAKVLGPACIRAGAKAYVGYKEDFIFAFTEGYSTRAEQDPLAKLFLEPTQKIAIHLVNGNSSKDSHEKGIREFQKNIQKVLLSNSTEKYVARFLVWDLVNQVHLQ